MTGRRRWHPPLDPEDLSLWEAVKATVTPLHPRPSGGPARLALLPPGEAQAPRVDHPPRPSRVDSGPKPAPAPAVVGLDRHMRRRIKRGAEPLTERVDLHGMTQETAHRQLLAFLRAAQARGVRVALVITGKGGPPGAEWGLDRGVLRRAVPQWLRTAEFRALVSGFDTAHPAHGGGGALYIHIRKARDAP